MSAFIATTTRVTFSLGLTQLVVQEARTGTKFLQWPMKALQPLLSMIMKLVCTEKSGLSFIEGEHVVGIIQVDVT